MNPRKKNASISSTALWIYVIFILVMVLAPVLYSFTGAFRLHNPTGILAQFLPTDMSIENFTKALNRIDLFSQLRNSIVVTIAQTSFQVITSVLAACALVFGRLRHPNIYFALILFTMMLPAEAMVASKFILINSMGLFDTVIAVFLPYAAAAFPVFLLRQHFLSFPMEIREAALLDGVGPLRFIWSFLLPLSKPMVFSVVVTSAIAAWNGYMWPLLVTESSASRTVQVGIKQLSDADSYDVGIVLAGVVIVTLPLILLIIVGNKFLTKGLTEGSDK